MIETDLLPRVDPSIEFRSFPMSRGTMHLQLKRQDHGIDDLMVMAERENPKRAFLFVSKVLGRHIPVQPQKHRRILRDLASKAADLIEDTGDILVMGYAETAVGLGAGIHDELSKILGEDRLGYLPSTRHPEHRETWLSFSEDHSHATAHHVLMPEDEQMRRIAIHAKTVVIVDDETTTGNTFINLISALTSVGRSFDRIILVTLTDWSDGKVAEAIADRTGLPMSTISSASLVTGKFSWTAADGVKGGVLPGPCPIMPGAGIAPQEGSWRAGITGETSMDDLVATLAPVLDCEDGRPSLVIGTGELVWHAFRLAEALYPIVPTSFLATTRSPVLQGEAIRNKAVFPDHYGIGVEMYLHNVDPAEWANIVLLTEGRGQGFVPPALAEYLGKFTTLSLLGGMSFYEDGKIS